MKFKYLNEASFEDIKGFSVQGMKNQTKSEYALPAQHFETFVEKLVDELKNTGVYAELISDCTCLSLSYKDTPIAEIHRTITDREILVITGTSRKKLRVWDAQCIDVAVGKCLKIVLAHVKKEKNRVNKKG